MGLSELESFRVRSGLDVFIIPDFAQKWLSFDPAVLQRDLESKYTIVGSGGKIRPSKVQWVNGDNAALKYRGNELKRAKIWLQRPSTESGEEAKESFCEAQSALAKLEYCTRNLKKAHLFKFQCPISPLNPVPIIS